MRDPNLPKLSPVQMYAANLQAHEIIRDSIIDGQFEPGDTLSTRQFASMLQVSQMPVREAFHRLVAEGALENRPNRTIGLPIIRVKEFRELTEIRCTLEGLATEKAAIAMDAETLKKLTAVSKQIEAADTEDITEYLRLNRQFHFTVYEASGSDSLFRMISQIWVRIGPLLNWSSRNVRNVEYSINFHNQVIEAIKARDGAAAKKAILGDVTEAAEIVAELLMEKEKAEAVDE
nr:GntR family transcriptional regulator [uncultured Cohaesibacter sp.]